jgi:hypothetical protein
VHPLYQVSMEGRTEVNPRESPVFVLLGREDVDSEMVLVNEPLFTKGVQDVEYR